MDITESDRDETLEILEQDSLFLSQLNLIDYSLLLLKIRDPVLGEEAQPDEAMEIDSNGKFRLSRQNQSIKEMLRNKKKGAKEVSDDSFCQDYFSDEDEDEERKGPVVIPPQAATGTTDEIDRKGTYYGGKVMRSVSGGYYYKIGVIDFMTRHSVMKTMETNIKSAFYNVKRNTISAQNPTDY